MTMTVRWPDGRQEECYSPSLVLHEHLRVGETCTVSDFEGRATAALADASERVRARFGYACTSAAASAERIRHSAAGHAPGDVVEIVRMWPPLPRSEPGR